MSRLLLCTDLDRTLLPNGSAPESERARPLFARLAAHPDVRVVYVTGRDTGRVDEAIARWDLPQPDLVIADVGTTIALRLHRQWERWARWDAILAADWVGLTTGDLQQRLSRLPGLTLQDASRQSRFKLSYYTPLGEEGGTTADLARQILSEAGVKANVIWSEDEQGGQGLLDVLPEAATKRLAIEHVMTAWNYTPDEVVFAGDSGNDLDVLISPIPAVLVANAQPEMKDRTCNQARSVGQDARLYCAGGGVLGMNGNYAAGILEGLLYFQPHWAEYLEGGA